MGFNIAGLGAVATGIQRGMDAGQDRRLRETEAGYRSEEMGRRRKKWKTEDDELALDQQANEAAQRVIQEDMRANQAPPGLGQAPMAAPMAPPMAKPMNATQADSTMGAEGYGPSSATPPVPGLADAAPMGAPAPAGQPKPYRPSQTVALRAAQARTDAYFAAGRIDKAQKHWAEDEGFRYSLRKSTVAPLKAALMQGGDITKPLQAFYDTMDDGSSITAAVATQGADGKVSYALEGLNGATGKTEKKVISAEQLAGQIDSIMQDPAKAAQQAFEMKLEAFKRQSTADENRLKHKDALDLAKVNNESREAGKAGDQARAIEVAKIGAGATLGAASIRAADGSGGGKGGRGGATDTRDIRALTVRSKAAEGEMNRISRLLPLANPADKPALQAQMTAARERMAEIDGQLSTIAKRGQGGGLADVAPKGGAAKSISKAEYDALPSGATYQRDGQTYRKK